MSFHVGHKDLAPRVDIRASQIKLTPRPTLNQLECFSSGSETQSDTSSELEHPLLDMLALDDHTAIVIDSQAGLTGRDQVAQFPCILANNKFYVWIGHTEYSKFGKSTLLNLADFAATRAAEDLLLVIDSANADLA